MAKTSSTKTSPAKTSRTKKPRPRTPSLSRASRSSRGTPSRAPRPSRPSRRTAPRPSGRRWSAEVTEHSDALDLKKGVFSLTDPKRIAASLKRSAEASRRKKTGAFRSALSMLTFYINRAGTKLSPTRRRTLMRAKEELRKQFGRA